MNQSGRIDRTQRLLVICVNSNKSAAQREYVTGIAKICRRKGVSMQKQKKEEKPYPPGGVCPACGAGAQPGAFDWMRLGRQHDRGGKEE